MTEKRFEMLLRDNYTGKQYEYDLSLFVIRLNQLNDENEQLQERNDRQAEILKQLYDLILNRDYKGQEELIEELEESERLLQKEMECYR